ncbi:LINE-1 reverse transcriptase like [Trifolium medium]|uniref:LINE-1 reverse transcriptase like n=1 Tax=Trifolium medium TaxID=97028 RepID=A0A392MGM2_9FABA|nr:LINE-1 reverse transcriptase like [Trifolium medium]
MFDQFYRNASLPKSFSSYFVALIPKVKSPFVLNEYRPISLLGCLYKLIAKVLAARLALVMNTIVASTQSAFLKGRLLVDGVLVVNEVVDLAKKSGKDCLIFKVDFEKAYDSVDWSFLDYMLVRFGFCDKWRAWIRACVFAGNMSVLVNGSAMEEINIQRGLKQGDPLAPFLFLLVAEGLGGLMKKAVEQNRFRGFEVGRNGVCVSHLQYADDTLCIGEASIENLWTLKAILRGFELVSGLKVNFSKSCVMGVNVSNDFIRLASAFLNCRVGSVPFKYLGLPVGANPRRASTWEPLLEAFRQHLGVWGNKYVSLGGRIVLLNAVLNAIPIFYLSFIKIPVVVWKKVRRIQREFLWGYKGGRNRISWVKWDIVCKPKKLGGLGVRDIRAVNISLLAKWRWRLLEDDNAMWKKVLKSKYGETVTGTVNLGEEWSGKADWMRGSNEILARYLGRYSPSAGKVPSTLLGIDSKGL